jgi:HD-GYP domain-containing protein (c-di-GMP phosphodiesterase class II)
MARAMSDLGPNHPRPDAPNAGKAAPAAGQHAEAPAGVVEHAKGLAPRIHKLERLVSIGIALSSERNRDRLVESILLEAKALCNADGGTIYLRTDDDHLRFAILRNDSLGLAAGGTTGRAIDIPPLPLFHPGTGEPNTQNVAAYAANLRTSVNVADAYSDEDEFDFEGVKTFDERNGYRSISFLTIPLVDHEAQVIGVLQLINAKDPAPRPSADPQGLDLSAVIPFSVEDQRIVEALASQAAVALDNRHLIEAQRTLLESFIKLIAAAIDAKSPYTGGHCERVPILTEMLATAACEAREGPFAGFDLDDEQWYELRIAAWLHDCGKVTTPVHVMDKATKLETIHDRIETVRARFAVLEREAELRWLRAAANGAPNVADLRAEAEVEIARLRDDLAFLERANLGGEFLSATDKARIRSIGARPYPGDRLAVDDDGEVTHEGPRTLLTDEELENLCISRGTLTDAERIVINGHMVQTIKMLEALPFPKGLERVPEYAGGHHEKMDGTGYPKGLYAGDMSVPARIMAIADVFEALTAQDRPYKSGTTLSEAMTIMGYMKADNHLDPDVFDLFVTSGVYREYGRRYLPAELIDEVDEAKLLAVRPKPYTVPDDDERRTRWRGFLAEYGGRGD